MHVSRMHIHISINDDLYVKVTPTSCHPFTCLIPLYMHSNIRIINPYTHAEWLYQLVYSAYV